MSTLRDRNAPPPSLEPPRTVLPGARRYAAVVLGLVLLVVLGTLTASIALDPYRVLSPNRGNFRNFEPNQRAAKLAQLAANGCAQFSGFVLGASRANAYPTDAVQATFGGRFYNMAVAGETVEGMRRRASWLIANCRPQHFVVTIDPQQFGWGADYGADLLRGEPPETGGPSKVRFMLRYLFLPPRALWLAGRELLFPRPIVYRVNLADGTHDAPQLDPSQSSARPVRVNHLPRICHAPEPIRPDLMAANLARLAALMATARDAGVRVTALVHPVNQNQLATQDFDQVIDWAEAVARITDRLLFFGGFNPITTDDAGFFDLSHFDQQVGRAVMEAAAGMTETPPEGLLGLYTAATAPVLRARLAANLAARAASCAAGRAG